MKKGAVTNIILVLVLIAGLSLLLYPSFSNYWNSRHQTRAIATYQEEVANLEEDIYEEILGNAHRYNEQLALLGSSLFLSDGQQEEYQKQLNLSGDGVMGYIEIPSISCFLPIYHGTDETVLQFAVGHLEWSSLPVGGAGTHTVLSGHRGLPSARLFTDLDKLREGDVFVFRILDEVLTYEVDQILIVEPDETDSLVMQEGKDLCTLVTCTPYGINTHRLLVRGHRIENLADSASVRVTADAARIDPLVIAAVLFGPFFLGMLAVAHIFDKKKKDMTEEVKL